MIDIVLCWVDNNDPQWQFEYCKYSNLTTDFSNNVRFRDWDNLRYLFRGIEKFAPWVNKVHFITCGHKPEWLNLNAPKLNFIKHSDYIPERFLPTFNSHTIELNYHRIKDLSDKFIYFNDDTFLINDVAKERFFVNDLPCDIAESNAITPCNGNIYHILCNNINLINRYFSKRDVISKNMNKWFSLEYIKSWYRTIVLLPWNNFTGFVDPHLPNSYLKSTFEKLWMLEPEVLEQTCSSRFRDNTNVNQYLMRYWRLCSGEFVPYNVYKDSAFIPICDANVAMISDIIANQKKSIVCLNDTNDVDFNKAKKMINKSFDRILPEKCSFEK